MELELYQVDAFAEGVFSGNPAAVVPLFEWLSDELLQNIEIGRASCRERVSSPV